MERKRITMNTCQYPDCQSYQENSRLPYCASHNLAERKAEKTAIKEAEKRKAITSKMRELKPKKQKAIKPVSENNTWESSDGTRYTSQEVAKNIHDAKARKLGLMQHEHGYFFCEECKENTGNYIDCSHTVSVDQCKKKGMVEYAWDVNNIRLLCRTCHSRFDRNDVRFNAS
jgi:hypothetical protein